MPVHLALEEQFDPYSFVKYIRDIGRAYQRQAIEIVTICRTFVQVSPQAYQHETKFKEAILAVDMALRLATEAGKKVTVAASKAFAEAQEKLVQYEESAHPRPSIANIATRMTQAKATDQRSLRLFNRLKAKCGIDVKTPNISSTQHINFVLLKSPVPDPKSLIVHQVFSSIQPMTSEILWNFSRYTDDRRIALRQNPHFYLNLPDAYGAGFFKDPTKDFVLKRNDTVIVYVLVDKPDLGRVYLEAEKRRVFGNVWMPNDVMIFKDIRGRLEGEQVVGADIQRHQELFWRNEPDISHNVSSSILRELPEDPWKLVTDIRDWKELIQKKILPSTRTSVKICVSNANCSAATNDEASHAPDKGAVTASSPRSHIPSTTNTTDASSSVHVGSKDTNVEVPPGHGADTKFLPQTQPHPIPLAPGPVTPKGLTHRSKAIAATAPSLPMPVSVPMPMPSVPAPPSAHAHPPTITATPHTMTWSPSPPPSHPSKAPATPESQKNVSSPQAPPTPSLSPGPNPSSKSMGATPIIKGPGNPTTQPHPQPASKSAKPASKQNRITKVDKPAQEVRGPTTKASISISTFTQVFKPRPSMPGAFPGPEMDVDWVMVDQGPAEIQGGNWLKRLFRRPS